LTAWTIYGALMVAILAVIAAEVLVSLGLVDLDLYG
jgi:hypothetical protein